MAYPTTAEISTDLAALVAANGFVSIVPLAASTKGTAIEALKISKVTTGRRAAVLFTGGIHGNELAPPKAILTCMQVLLDAYKPPGKGITYGAFSLTKQNVKDIVEHVDIYALPLANPDGYDLALSLPSTTPNGEITGRKNGNPTSTTCVLPKRPGVDINRNCDILWNFEKHYAPTNNVRSSSDPCENTYTGITPGPVIGNPFSEPEAENIKTLLDLGIEFYIDCHMHGPTILHPWGIETNQSADPNMNFRNAATFDGLRNGTVAVTPPNLDYQEFIDAAELAEMEQLAHHMAKAIKDGTDVGSRAANPFKPYTVQQSALLYPDTGSAEDYAYSRHLVNPALPWVRSFIIECGNASHTGFRADAAQYAFVEQEVHCALLAFLQAVATWIGKQNAPPTPPPPTQPSKGCFGCLGILMFGLGHPAVLRHLRELAGVIRG